MVPAIEDGPPAVLSKKRGQSANDASHQLGEIISIRPDVPLETTEALREGEARFRALLSSMEDLVFELDENGVYLSIWTTDESLLIASPSELLGRTPREALGEDVGRRMTLAVRRVVETGRKEVLEYCLEVPAGSRWFQGRLAPIVGSSSPTVCLLVRDITEQKAVEVARDEAERRLQHLAMYDVLTDLPNRVFFRDRLDHALKRTRRRHEELIVLVLDLDQFKDVNDTFGHAAGDKVLQEVAQRLAKVTRDGDSVARLGGDEFALLLSNASDDEATKIAQRVSDCLKREMTIGTSAITTDISVGFAVFPRDGADADTLLDRADGAMYADKRAHGKAR